MKVLGLNGWSERGHDGGATLIVDGKLIFSIEEEKLILKRHAYDTLPKESIKAALNYGKLTLDDIDKVCIGWNYEKLYEMLGKKFITKEEMSFALFEDIKYANKIEYIDHHIAHAYSAFVPSNFDKSLVLIIDGQGEYIGTSLYYAERENNKMSLLMETPASLGYFYSAITNQIGFRGGEEGKTMGLASYGKPCYYDLIKKYIYIENDVLKCSFTIPKVSKDEEDATIAKWETILSTVIPKRSGRIEKVTDEIIPYANLAASAQKILDEVLRTLLKKYAKDYNVHNVCIAGGVGLNCPTSTSIERMDIIENVFVQPASNDGGISLGAAIKGAIDCGDEVLIEMVPYLGNEYSDEQIKSTLINMGYEFEVMNNVPKTLAKLINEGNIVANYQGRLELGPRALGNRSLLASPKKYEMLVRMNNLKGREVWRPLAPAVLFECQKEYFGSDIFSPHMTKNFDVVENKKCLLQAITHVDGTSRVQSVTRDYNELFYEIINEFYKLSGIPVLINTSFNVKGEPIVCTPKDAINSFERMNLDYLAVGKYLVKGKNGSKEV